MTGKWWALSAIALGIGLIVAALREPAEGAQASDQFATALWMLVGGIALIVGGVGYLIVRGFMAL